MVTVFTPTYNRAYTLPRLYESLGRQTCRDFEWLIVDDGSTDGTEEIVRGWIGEASFPMRYIKQQNGGKHRAINRGVGEAKGELFFIVDSDDYLTDDAIEIVLGKYEKVKNREDVAGVVGFRIGNDGKKINVGRFDEELICNVIDYQYRHNGVGDMAEAYRTDVLRKFPFPDVDDEKFCTEGLVWNRIGREHKMLYFDRGIYVCNYLTDGLTAKMTKLRHQNPVYATTYYSEAVELDIPLWAKVKNAVNYWRFFFDKSAVSKPKISWRWFLEMPVGLAINVMERI